MENMLDYSLLVIDLLGFFTILGIGYYASRIMIQMRTGLLEKSWRYLVAAAYVLQGGVVVFLVQQFATSTLIVEVTSHLSAVLLVISGGFFYALILALFINDVLGTYHSPFYIEIHSFLLVGSAFFGLGMYRFIKTIKSHVESKKKAEVSLGQRQGEITKRIEDSRDEERRNS